MNREKTGMHAVSAAEKRAKITSPNSFAPASLSPPKNFLGHWGSQHAVSRVQRQVQHPRDTHIVRDGECLRPCHSAGNLRQFRDVRDPREAFPEMFRAMHGE